MPLPLIPLLIGGATLLGLGGTVVTVVSAHVTNESADADIKEAKGIVCKAESEQKQAQEELESALLRLGELKRDIYAGNMKLCQDCIEGLLEGGACGAELAKLTKTREFQKMRDNTSTVLGALSGGLGGLGLSGLGVGGVVLLGHASTGATLSSLSGVAFSNALKAWFGGGSLAAGGLGIAVGGPLLICALCVPALLVGGIVASNKADERQEQAREYLAKAKKYAKDVESAVKCTQGLVTKAEEISKLLDKINSCYFGPLLKRLQVVPRVSYEEQSEVCQRLIQVCAIVAERLDDLMNTPLLVEGGELSPKIEELSPERVVKGISALAEPFFVPGVL